MLYFVIRFSSHDFSMVVEGGYEDLASAREIAERLARTDPHSRLIVTQRAGEVRAETTVVWE